VPWCALLVVRVEGDEGDGGCDATNELREHVEPQRRPGEHAHHSGAEGDGRVVGVALAGPENRFAAIGVIARRRARASENCLLRACLFQMGYLVAPD
jgi:hypothetical protein